MGELVHLNPPGLFDGFSLKPEPYPEEEGAPLVEWYCAEMLRRGALYEAINASSSVRKQIIKWCKNGITDEDGVFTHGYFFFVDNFGWTFDPREVGPTRPSHTLPMHLWDFQRWLSETGVIWRDDNGLGWPRAIEKSRDMGATWTILHEYLWGWLFHGRSYGVISRKEEEVDDNTDTPDSLFGRIRWILAQLPRMLRPKGWRNCHKKRPRFVDKKLHIINPETKNQIVGGSTVSDAFRSRRYFRICVDEANAIPELAKIVKSLTSCTDSPDYISSVCGRHTAFARITHGEDGIAIRATKEPAVGVGNLVVKLHYELHPHKKQDTERGRAWKRRAQAINTEEGFAQEHEIDYFASLPSRCWPTFSRSKHVMTEHQWEFYVEPVLKMDDCIRYLTWDYGYGTAFTVATSSIFVPHWDILVVEWSMGWQDADAERVATELTSTYDIKTNFGGWIVPDLITGDPSGSSAGPSQHGGAKLEFAASWVENLAEVGIVVHPSGAKPYSGIVVVRKALKHGKILFGPLCLETNDKRVPPIVDAVESHVWTSHGGEVTLYDGKPKPAKNTKASHASDTLIEAAWEPWMSSGQAFENIFQGEDHGYRGY